MNRPSQLDWQDLEFDSRSAGDVYTLISEIGPNPWLTLGIMDQIEDESLLAEWDAGLDHQTRMLAPREISWMRQHGLGDGASGILEVGSANGNYGAALARSLPDRRVYGLEANPHLAARLRPDDAPDNYTIDICRVGDHPLPDHIAGRFDRCVLRFVAQHVSDPLRLLRTIHDTLPSGGMLYVIEEDDAFFTAHPPAPPFEAAFAIWRRVCAAGGSNSKIGRELPWLAREAGFEIEAFDIHLRNNIEAGDHLYRQYANAVRVFHRTNPELVPADEMEQTVAGLEALAAHQDAQLLATYPQFYLAAKR